MSLVACGPSPVATLGDDGGVAPEVEVIPERQDSGVVEDADAGDIDWPEDEEPEETDAGELSSEDEDPGDAGVTPGAGGAPDSGVATPADAGVAGHLSFRVMTYNVRGPLDTGAHAWRNRRAAVVQRILDNAPDIVGVQEAQVASGEDLPADLIAGLQSVYGYYRPSGSSPKLIFYKKTRFTRFAQGKAALPNPYAAGHLCATRAAGKHLAWAKLRDRLTGREYFVGNTHFAWSSACGEGRRVQAVEVKAVIGAQAGALPVVLLGDFNVDDQRSGETAIEVLESEGRALFRTARHDGATSPDHATFNARWNGSGTNTARLDYIFHSGRALTSSAPTIDRWPGTDTGTPSDHFPVLATLREAVFEPGSTLVQVPDGENEGARLYFADVDGDGCADQLSWSSTFDGGQTWWARSSCTGTFSAPQKMTGATSGVASTRFFFADLTGDGCAEKISWRPTYDAGNLRFYRGRCDGTFDAVETLPGLASASEATHFFFARVSGSRCADLVRWNAQENGGRLSVFSAACQGQVAFGAERSAAGGAQPQVGTALFFADVDGDGRDDAIAWHPQVSGGQTRVFKADGAGTFSALFTHTAGSSGVASTRFFFADFTGDGYADKYFWRPGFRNGRGQLYPGTGSGFAGSPLMDNTGWSQSERTAFLFADTDGDGRADKTYWNPGANGGAAKVFRAR